MCGSLGRRTQPRVTLVVPMGVYSICIDGHAVDGMLISTGQFVIFAGCLKLSRLVVSFGPTIEVAIQCLLCTDR